MPSLVRTGCVSMPCLEIGLHVQHISLYDKLGGKGPGGCLLLCFTHRHIKQVHFSDSELRVWLGLASKINLVKFRGKLWSSLVLQVSSDFFFDI